MTGIIIRLVVAAVAIVVAVRMLKQAKVARVEWAQTEVGISRAESWWSRAHGGPFDQERTAVPEDVAPYLGPNGPRTDLRAPRPAQARWVWGWLLIVIATLLLISVMAQFTSGTA